MEIYSNKIEISFSNSVSANKAKEIACQVIAANQEETWSLNAAKNTIRRLVVDGTTLKHPEQSDADLLSDELLRIMPLILKAIAELLPSENFNFDAVGYDTYTEGWIEGKYENGLLEMKSTYYPQGYEEYLFCPECGEIVTRVEAYDPQKTYYCPECGEEIDLSAEYEETKPIVECSAIRIA